MLFRSVNLGYGETSGETAWVQQQTSLIGHSSVDINVDDHTQIDGALVANIDEQWQDQGNLKLKTKTFGHSNFQDVDKEESDYLSFNIGTSPSSTGKQNSVRNWGVEGSSYERDRAQQTNATLGSGTLIVTQDLETGKDSTAGLNRDINTAQVITKDEEETTDLYVTNSSLEAVANPIDTGKEWANGLRDYGKNATLTFINMGRLAEEGGEGASLAVNIGSAVADGMIEIMDKLGNYTAGLFPSVANHGGAATQVPALIFGDQQNNHVKVKLKINKYGQYEIDEVTILDNNVDPANLPDDIRYAFVNGIMNSLEDAARNGAMQTGADSLLVAYNPTHGFLADMIESGWDKTIGQALPDAGSGNSWRIAAMFQQWADDKRVMNTAAHSQGGLLVYTALRMLDQGTLAAVTRNDDKGNPTEQNYQFQINGAPVNTDDFIKAIEHADASIGDHLEGGHNINPSDPVALVLGRNAGNWPEFLESVLQVANLFKSEVSPHSNYFCQGDFCDDKQIGVGPNP